MYEYISTEKIKKKHTNILMGILVVEHYTAICAQPIVILVLFLFRFLNGFILNVNRKS